MNIEKLNDNKVRITLNMSDLESKKVDFHSFMSNSIESQELFLDMLEEAEKKVGFITDNYKIMVEAIALANGNFVFTITRALSESSPEKKKKLHIKRKVNSLNTNKSIYLFINFEDFCAFCNSLNFSTILNYKNFYENTSLYFYKNNYYLVFSNINANLSIAKNISYAISEFACFVNSSELFERKLKEHGNEIIKNNAIVTCLKHF